MTSDQEVFHRAKAAVISVGEGRGFLIERCSKQFIITAAHCLPMDCEWDVILPYTPREGYTEERTYRKLLASLDGEPAISAECLFVDLVADIAVLGRPDGQIYFEEANAFDQLVESATPIEITDASKGEQAWLLSVDGEWFPCGTSRSTANQPIWLDDAEGGIKSGMSGSPIVSPDGEAFGILCISSSFGEQDRKAATKGRLIPLVQSLPGWLLYSHSDQKQKRPKSYFSDAA
jgi:hypothetical protein